MGKRKLHERDEKPVVSEPSSKRLAVKSFADFSLDPRLLQAVAKEKYAKPTPVQSEAIPLALEGKDVLARAKTGTGKTAAYLLPILQSILKRKFDAHSSQHTTALILVPTRELASQVSKTSIALSAFCAKEITTVNLASQIHDQALKALLAGAPDIVVATPAKALQHIHASSLPAGRLLHLVIDEADLVMSYGYNQDFPQLLNLLPSNLQAFLASATLTPETETLSGLFCHDPAVINLQDEEDKSASTVSQYVVHCGEDEKFLLLFALFKLKLIQGKCIVFVGDVDRSYRVKLYLEQFGIKSCVLNSELPVNCRIHAVDEFNKNVYDIIVATDENEIVRDEGSKPDLSPSLSNAQDRSPSRVEITEQPDASKSKLATDSRPRLKNKPTEKDYGISRGIDFNNVACVLNFDLPQNSKSYTHRIGRTARAGRAGIALSFSIPRPLYRKHRTLSLPSTQNDEAVLTAIMSAQKKREHELKPYAFDMVKLEGFRYRVSSALKAITPGAIRQARLTELKGEMLRSERLKRHLEENPEDLRYLRHDMETRAARVQPHMKHVPDYLMPGKGEVGKGQGPGAGSDGIGHVGFGRQGENRIRKARERNKSKGRGRKKVDALKSFSAGRR